jgi:adenylate cyclase
MGLWRFYAARGEYQRARALAEQFTRLAQNVHDPSFLLPVHYTLGFTLFRLGEFAAARERFEQGIALYDPQQRRLDRSDSLFHGQNPGLGCLSWLFWALWYLGYPDQALKRIEEAHELVRELGRPASEAFIRYFAATVHRLRREGPVVREYVESVITLSNEHGLSYWLASGTFLRGWALAEQGQKEEGIAQMLRGLEAWRALGIEQLGQPSVILAEVCGQVGQVEEGLRLLDTALTQLQASGERWWEAELWRVKGELVLRFTRGHEVPALQHCAG